MNSSVLTPTQHRILRLLAGGHSTRETAAALHISHHTVRMHRRDIISRLNANSMTHAVANAFRLGELGPARVSSLTRSLVQELAVEVQRVTL